MQCLQHIVELSKFVPSLTKLLIDITNRVLDTQDPRREYEASCANSAWLVGTCMECIAERPTAEWADSVDIPHWTTRVVERWGWSGRALEGLALLVAARYAPHLVAKLDLINAISSPTSATHIPLDRLYENLKSSLLSHSRALRLQTLRLFGSSIIDIPPETTDLLKKALQAEEISIDVQGVRERVLRIGRLSIAVKDGDQIGADICGRWLIGTRLYTLSVVGTKD